MGKFCKISMIILKLKAIGFVNKFRISVRNGVNDVIDSHIDVWRKPFHEFQTQ